MLCFFFVFFFVPQSQIELNYTENCIGKTQIVLENQQQIESKCRASRVKYREQRTVYTL